MNRVPAKLSTGAVTIAVALVLAACGSSSNNSGGTLTPMLFTLQPNLNAVNFYIAADKGFFKGNGIDATITPVDIGFHGVQTVVANQSQAGGCSVYPMLNILSQGGNQVVPAVYAVVNIQKIIVRKGINSPADLVGKKVAITTGSIFEFSFVQYLKNQGVDPSSVKIISVDAPDQAAAMKRGDIDAAVNVDPTASQILSAMGSDAHILSPGIDFKDRVYLQMNRDWVKTHRNAVIGMLKALVQASNYLKTNQADAEAIVAKNLSLTPTQVHNQMVGWTFDVTLQQDAVDEAVTTAQFMLANGLLKSAVDAKSLFDPSLLKAVDPSLVSVS